MGSFVSYFLRREDQIRLENDTVNSETGFSLRQQKMMRKSWDQYIRPNLIDVGVETMLSLFDAYPDIKQMFPDFKDLPKDQLKGNKKFHAHCQMIMSTINNAVDAFLNNDIQLFTMILKMTGERHAKRSSGKITADHFNRVKDPLTAVLKKRMNITWKLISDNQNDDNVIKLWARALDQMIQIINSGIDDYKNNI
ncbi:uncharacterized protein glob1 [Chelonus insularis]|uniref:uncharacterized protein glob1 n=1 Tax=Chelonus insularis TaxID=460826 RepID=UPI00158CFFBA|nr:uncharacterized protein LOC118065925 [Chelonus insularis]